MGDIVERLRAVDHMNVEECFLDSHMFAKAADEIERLREALRQIAKQWPDSFAARTARAALKGDE